jgi:hypothetical protein
MTREEVKEKMVGLSWNTVREAWRAFFSGGRIDLFDAFMNVEYVHLSKTDTITIRYKHIQDIVSSDDRVRVLLDSGSFEFYV